MKSLKMKLSLIFVVSIIFFSIIAVYAANIEYTLTLDGEAIEFGETYEVEGGEEVLFKIILPEGARLSAVGYVIGVNGDVNQLNNSEVKITIPEGEVGESNRISFSAAYMDEDGNQVQMAWKSFIINYVNNCEDEENTESQINMTIKFGSKTLNNKSSINVEGGDIINVKATSTVASIQRIGYYFSTETSAEDIVDIYEDEIDIVIPEEEPGTIKYLWIEAIATNDDGTVNTVTKTGWQQIKLIYSEISVDGELNSNQQSQDINVEYTVDESYTIIIPPDLILNLEENVVPQEVAAENVRLSLGKNLVVNMKSANWSEKDKYRVIFDMDSIIKYNIKKGISKNLIDTEITDNNVELLNLSAGETEENVYLKFFTTKENISKATKSGKHTDVLTFSCELK